MLRGEKPVVIESPSLLAVEGKHLCSFFERMLQHARISGVQLFDLQGQSDFKARLQALLRANGIDRLRSLGIIVDAEERHAQSAFQSAVSALSSAVTSAEVAIEIPTAVRQITRGGCACGIFVLPDCNSSGCFEDLVVKIIETLPVSTCVDAFIECARSSKVELRRESKARVAAYFALTTRPESSFTTAYKQGHIPLEHPELEPLKNFLTELFA